MEQGPSWKANRFQLVKKFPHFMESERSLLQSQVPTTCPYPEPACSSPCPPHPTSWRSILILSSHLRLGIPSGLFPSGFPTKTLYTPLLLLLLLLPIHATCPAHLILPDSKIGMLEKQILTAFAVFLAIARCNLISWYQHFGATYFLHL